MAERTCLVQDFGSGMGRFRAGIGFSQMFHRKAEENTITSKPTANYRRSVAAQNSLDKDSTSKDIPGELEAARKAARQSRLQANRALACATCDPVASITP